MTAWRIGLSAWIIILASMATVANGDADEPRPERVQYPVIRGQPSFSYDGRYLGLIVENRDKGTRKPCSRVRVLDTTTWMPIESGVPEVTAFAGLAWAPNEQAFVCGLWAGLG
ncbi:MAG TPA: hypothetical protein VMV94_16525, partial [Phycisphaerae bacterium]|nr:hypothetical protein [Phycisphaerae bacterium]